MEKAIDKYCGNEEYGYQLVKALNVGLKPTEKTREYISTYGIIEKDKERYNDSYYVQKWIDRIHKRFIKETLDSMNVDMEPLIEAKLAYMRNSDAGQKKKLYADLKTCEEKTVKKISSFFTSRPEYNKLFDKSMFLELLPEVCTQEEMEIVKKFDKFYSYFTKFNGHREFIYGPDCKKGTIAYRIAVENIDIFVENMISISRLEETLNEYGESFSILEKFKNLWSGKEGRFPVSDADITSYNLCISGNYNEKGCIEKGIAQESKEFRDAHKVHVPKIKQLWKNILSDTDSLFTVSRIESTQEIIEGAKKFEESRRPVINNFIPFIKPCNLGVSGRNLRTFSHLISGDYNFLSRVFAETGKDILGAKEIISFAEIDQMLMNSEEHTNARTAKYFEKLLNFDTEKRFKAIDFSKITDLQVNKYEVKELKAYLQECVDFYRMLRLTDVGEDIPLELDVEYYDAYDTFKDSFGEIVPFYNSVRNFVTKKVSKERTFPLNFGYSKFLAGWADSKLTSNGGMLLRDDAKGKLYFAVLNKQGPNVNKVPKIRKNPESDLKKLCNSSIPGAAKMLPHIFFSKKNIEVYKPSEEFMKNYKEGKYKQGPAFDLDFCHELIDFYKSCIEKHEDYKVFKFNFKPTSEYNSASEFFNDVDKGGYYASMEGIDRNEFMSYVEDGSVFLFELYNKYLAGKSHGKDKVTDMLRILFSDESSSELQLTGNGRVQYRPPVSNGEVVHHKGDFIVNKYDANGYRIKDEIYMDIVKHLNHGTRMSDDARKLFESGIVKYKKADRDIIKDRRFTIEHFNLCLIVNCNSSANTWSSVEKFNKSVLEDIKNNKDINFLSINRGENNLIYAVLQDQDGNIIFDKSFNLVPSNNVLVDYRSNLVSRAASRLKDRQDWQEIEGIKSMKEGYISYVTGCIADLMVKYNSVLLLESLSSDFKDRRKKIESNVYETFEKKLIEKLSCLTFKGTARFEKGSCEKPYQLCPKFKSLDSIYTQFGWIFFVNPAYLSKIDPSVGFANIFDMHDITNYNDRCDFLEKFSYIGIENGKAIFRGNGKKFSKISEKDFEIVATGKRNIWNKEEKTWELFDLDEAFEKALELVGIKEGENIVEKVKEMKKSIINNMFATLVMKVFEVAVESKTHVKDDYLYVAPTMKKSSFEGKSIDMLAAFNMGYKFRIMLDSCKEGNYVSQIKNEVLLNN